VISGCGMGNKFSLPISVVRDLFDYDPRSGILSWRHCRTNSIKVGQVISCVSSNGYIMVGVSVDGKKYRYLAHQIIVAWMLGRWPIANVDHRSRDKTDNRWGNLRECSRSQNAVNSKVRCDNRSGVRGVSWDKERATWRAQICVNGRRRVIGRFATLELARAAYSTEAVDAFGEFVSMSQTILILRMRFERRRRGWELIQLIWLP
jgi:hypothetical protein